MRRVASIFLLVVAGVLFPLVVLANWAGTTVFDSDTFSERAVEPLNSEPVREELARRLTEQLVRAGNQQAVNFRPAFELALEGVIDSDTFRAIFRNAVRHTHQAILAGQGGGQGIDLGASFAIISQSLQVSGGAGNAATRAEGTEQQPHRRHRSARRPRHLGSRGHRREDRIGGILRGLGRGRREHHRRRGSTTGDTPARFRGDRGRSIDRRAAVRRELVHR